MKEITMQEAMRAIADGKPIFYADPKSCPNHIKPQKIPKYPSDPRFYFTKDYYYYIKETVKVALFKHEHDPIDRAVRSFTERELLRAGQLSFVRVSDWVEIEVNE